MTKRTAARECPLLCRSSSALPWDTAADYLTLHKELSNPEPAASGFVLDSLRLLYIARSLPSLLNLVLR